MRMLGALLLDGCYLAGRLVGKVIGELEAGVIHGRRGL